MYLVVSMVIMALVTYLIRAIPLVCFNKEIKSIYIRSFLYYVPYAVLAAMTFPHILYATDNMMYSILALGIAIILSYLEKSLTIVAVSTVAVVYLCHILG